MDWFELYRHPPSCHPRIPHAVTGFSDPAIRWVTLRPGWPRWGRVGCREAVRGPTRRTLRSLGARRARACQELPLFHNDMPRGLLVSIDVDRLGSVGDTTGADADALVRSSVGSPRSMFVTGASCSLGGRACGAPLWGPGWWRTGWSMALLSLLLRPARRDAAGLTGSPFGVIVSARQVDVTARSNARLVRPCCPSARWNSPHPCGRGDRPCGRGACRTVGRRPFGATSGCCHGSGEGPHRRPPAEARVVFPALSSFRRWSAFWWNIPDRGEKLGDRDRRQSRTVHDPSVLG